MLRLWKAMRSQLSTFSLPSNSEPHHAVRALADRLAVGSGDMHAVDEDEPEIAVLGRPRRGDVGLEAGRQQLGERRVRHAEIELEAVLDALLGERLGDGGECE